VSESRKHKSGLEGSLWAPCFILLDPYQLGGAPLERAMWVPGCSEHTSLHPALQTGTTVRPCCWTVLSVWVQSWSTTLSTATGTASTEARSPDGPPL
jgi:hypothetical protein